MLEELSKTVKAQLYERVSSPLLGSFILAWCGWNYKFILVLISSMDVDKKIAFINANLYPSTWDRALEAFIYPLATTIILIFVYPWPARWVFSFSRRQQVALKKLQQAIDDDTPLSIEDARELRRSNNKIAADFEEEITRYKNQIERQRAQLDIASESLKNQGDAKQHLAQLLEQIASQQRLNNDLSGRLKESEDNVSELHATLESMRARNLDSNAHGEKRVLTMKVGDAIREVEVRRKRRLVLPNKGSKANKD